MAENRSYARYGGFVLLRRLEDDAVAETWRAARLDNGSLTDTVALLRFKRGSAGTFAAAFHATEALTPDDAGSTIVKGQRYETIEGDPIIVWDYDGGRSLARVLTESRGSSTSPAIPIPLDQTLAIAEKLATSLEASSKLQKKGSHVHHGALLPRFVWIAEDGDVRTLGHGLGRAVAEAVEGTEDEGYLAPEIRAGQAPGPASEVYGIGALLFAMLGGHPPADGKISFERADEIHDEPIPDAIRSIVERALHPDPAERYLSPGAFRKAIQALTQEGDYAPTTFNLAFYLHSLMRDELDAEPAERQLEQGIDISLIPLYNVVDRPDHSGSRQAHVPVEPAAPVAESRAPSMFATEPAEPKKNRLPLIAAIIGFLIVGSAAGWYFTAGPGGSASTPAVTADSGLEETSPAETTRAPQAMVVLADRGDDPVEVLPGDGQTTDQEGNAESGAVGNDELTDPARDALIQEEIERRYQEKIAQVQAELDRELRQEEEERRRQAAERKKQEAAATPPPSSPPSRIAASRPEPSPASTTQNATSKPAESVAMSAEELDRQAMDGDSADETSPSTSTDAEIESPVAEPRPEPIPAVREGDLVSFGELDVKPTFKNQARLDYPSIARRQKVEETILVSVLISETGEVLETKIVKGESRKLGFDSAAKRAVDRSTFNPGMKDGKRVKTWYVFPVAFKLGG